MNFLLILLTIVGVFTSTLLQGISMFANVKENGKITFAGRLSLWILYGGLVTGIVVVLIQNYNNTKTETSLNNEKVAQSRREDSTRKVVDFKDSLNKASTDSIIKNVRDSAKRDNKNLIEILAKYGLKIDSSNNEIKKIKSAGEPDPALQLAIGSNAPPIQLFKGDRIDTLLIKIINMGAPCTNFDVSLNAYIKDDTGLEILPFEYGSQKSILGKMILAEGQGMTKKIYIIPSRKLGRFHLWINGTYTNMKNTRYTIDEVAFFDFESEEVGFLLGEYAERVRSVFRKERRSNK